MRFVAPVLMSVLLTGLLTTVTARARNTLTLEEQQGGWKVLFDGTSADHWRGYQKPDLQGLRWVVKDGCLALPQADKADTAGARDIITKEEFDDFELAWEWRVAAGSNSGLKYFVRENRPDAIGHEYQLIDDARHEDAAEREGRRSTAAFYDVLAAPAAKGRIRPAGTLNQSRIVVRHNHVEHWLNGARVLSYELGTDALRAAIADSKFKGIDGFDRHVRGHLLLQDHGDAICFRNIRVRELR